MIQVPPFHSAIAAGLLALVAVPNAFAAKAVPNAVEASRGERAETNPSLPPVVAVAVAAVVDNMQGAAEARDYRVKPGDMLTLSVEGEPDLIVEAVIGDDGLFVLPGIEEAEQAAGLSLDDLRAVIEIKLRKSVPGAVVSLVLRQPGGRRIFAVGKLQRSAVASTGAGSAGGQAPGEEDRLPLLSDLAPEPDGAQMGTLALNQLDSPFTEDLGSRVSALALNTGDNDSFRKDGAVTLSGSRVFHDISVVRGGSFNVSNFLAPSAGRVTVSVTDVRWRSLLSQLSTTVTSSGNTLGRFDNSGNLSFSVLAGQRFAIAIFAAASNSARLGLYRLDVSFQPTAAVPLPAGGWLLLSGLAALAARRRLGSARRTPAVS